MTTMTNLPELNKRNSKQIEEMKWIVRMNPTAEYHNYGSLHYFTFESAVRGVMKPRLVWFWGNSKKIAGNFYYRNLDDRTAKIEGLKKSADVDAKYKAEKKAVKSGSTNVKVGDVFIDSWGYEQTNVDFYQVVKLVGKTTVVVRPISSETIGEPTSWCSDKVKPVKDSFLRDRETGEFVEYKKRVTKWGKGETDYSFKTSSYSSARPTTWGATHHRSWGY